MLPVNLEAQVARVPVEVPGMIVNPQIEPAKSPSVYL
jgi:hypothetical protein